VVYPQPNGRDVPHAWITIEPKLAGMNANAVIRALQEGDPPICVFERLADSGTIVIMPEALSAGEAQIVARRLKQLLTSRRSA